VSVIIPCFNRAWMIGDAIRSALDQTHPPSEVIVVDDGSTDDSLDVARSFGPRVHSLHQENAGAAAARNTGLAAATGEFVAFLDSDDLWKPVRIERQLELFKTRPHLSVVHSLVEWGEGFPPGYGPRAEATAHYPDHDDDWARLFCSAVMYTSCVMVRRSALRRTGGFDADLYYWEDMNLWLRAALLGPLGLLKGEAGGAPSRTRTWREFTGLHAARILVPELFPRAERGPLQDPGRRVPQVQGPPPRETGPAHGRCILGPQPEGAAAPLSPGDPSRAEALESRCVPGCIDSPPER